MIPQILSTYKLGKEQLDLMSQLNVWTRCCEFSVAASIHDCLDEDVRAAISKRLPPASTAALI